MSQMHDALLDHWGLPRPRVLAPTSGGWNNESFFVTSAVGEHVLRISAIATPAQVAFEHRVLGALRRAGLPFATPAPVVGVGGTTVAMAEVRSAVRPASLFSRISGTVLDDGDQPGVTASGIALAQLDATLARIDIQDHGAEAAGDLERVSPAVPSLTGIHEESGADAMRLMRRTSDAAHPLYRTLPRQLIHGDYAFGNVLMNGGRVAALVDFEFCGRDLRAMELASAVGLVLTKGARDQLWRPFVRAYVDQQPLTDAEIDALPTLIRLAKAIGLVWWIGRQRLGLSLAEDTAARVRRLMDVDGWLRDHAVELTAELRSARRSR